MSTVKMTVKDDGRGRLKNLGQSREKDLSKNTTFSSWGRKLHGPIAVRSTRAPYCIEGTAVVQSQRLSRRDWH